jgi:hypothetical protein
MAHIFTGIIFLLTALLLVVIDRFFPYIDFMSSFTAKGFKRLTSGLSIVGVILLSFGVYSYLTYEPPFIHLDINSEGYIVDGDIGNIAYIQKDTEIFHKGVESTILLVSWNNTPTDIYFEDDVGEVQRLSHDIKLMKNDMTEKVNKEIEAKWIYEVPFSFDKEGRWKIIVKDGTKKIGSFQLKVYE